MRPTESPEAVLFGALAADVLPTAGDIADLFEGALSVNEKAMEEIFADTEVWELMRQEIVAVVEPIFREAFMVGAELGAEEAPTLTPAEGERAGSLLGLRELPLNRRRVSAVSSNLIANYTDTWWRQFERSTQNSLRRSIQRSVDQGTGVGGVITDIAPLFGRKRAELIAISEVTNLVGMGAQETYREAGYTEWEWRTVRDGKVDPICQALDKKVFPMSVKFERAHPRCRCWPVPAGKPAGFGPLDTTTRTLHTTRSGRWRPERVRLHDQIVRDFKRGATPVAENEQPAFHMMGGGPASGKSSVIESGQVKFPANRITIDPDAIKAKLPEYQQMLSQGDARAAAFAHEESSYLSQRIVQEATAERFNILLDGTGDGSFDKLTSRLATYRADGHRVVAEYVSLDTETAVQIQRVRAAATGRQVPESYVREVHASISETVPRVLRDGGFDEFRLWDTNIKDSARLVASYEDEVLTVHDETLWRRFLAKADEGGLDDAASNTRTGEPFLVTDAATVEVNTSQALANDD